MQSTERLAAELDIHFVLPRLAIGGRLGAHGPAELAERFGVTHVVDLRLEAHDDPHHLATHGIELLSLPTEDHCAVAADALDLGVDWVNAAIDRGERVYVHCEHGIGRSALLVLCVLVSRGDDPTEALARAKGVRWKVSPSPAQLEAFLAWCEGYHARRGDAPPDACFDTLAAIAYAHLHEG